MEIDYDLLDSGNGLKLERFSEKILIRPSSLAIWDKSDEKLWKKADAVYDLDKGWCYLSPRFDEWSLKVGSDLQLILRLQDNGQVGLFPEHHLYLDQMIDAISDCKKDKVEVLNLFAYTGMASILCAKAGAFVTHLDLSRKALKWAKQNVDKNGLKGVRFIEDDAVTFVQREIKRGKKYDLIIVDPPNFSRTDKRKSWNIENILPQLLGDLATLSNERVHIFATSHYLTYGAKEMMSNILRQKLQPNEIFTQDLTLKELHSENTLPAGTLVYCKRIPA